VFEIHVAIAAAVVVVATDHYDFQALSVTPSTHIHPSNHAN